MSRGLVPRLRGLCASPVDLQATGHRITPLRFENTGAQGNHAECVRDKTSRRRILSRLKLGIPSRLGFSIVQNHLSTEKFVKMLRSNKFVFHGYNEFLLDGNWIKCTPAFNKLLCEKFGTVPLEFDGVHDSIFQEFSPDGQRYMKYLHEYGQFDDLPYDLFVSELKVHYPHLFDSDGNMITRLGE